VVRFLVSFLFVASLASAQALPSDVCQSLKEERAKYPSDISSVCTNSNDANCPLGYILNTVAWKYRADGWGMSKKDYGYFVYSPAGPIASDILQRNNVMWDVFINSSQQAIVTCNQFVGTASRPFVAPVPYDNPPEPPPTDCEELKKENEELRKKNLELQRQLDNVTCKCTVIK